MAAFQALQQHDLLNGQQQQSQHHQSFHHHHQQQQHQQQQAAAAAAAVAAAAQAAANHAAGQMVGRQGAIKDVRSIIEDYRQRHPETVPRRGRRMKTVPTATNSSDRLMMMSSPGSSGSSLMVMQMLASSSRNNTSSPCLFNPDDIAELGGVGGGEEVLLEPPSESPVAIAGAQVSLENKIRSKKVAVSGGKLVGKSKDRDRALSRIKQGGAVGGASATIPRRGSEWQVMLSSLGAKEESGNSAAPTASSSASATSSGNSSPGNSAINTILTHHPGILSTISITSIGGGSSAAGADKTGGVGGGSLNGNSLVSIFLRVILEFS